ncbi:hypothetical protein KDH_67540 [Dictyobacter sp. S3.2.2.5]|uniref:LamG-like jellyroll fold domain-containing protein n=1 Tax=Dictyobacter halimunensis TaxID=3026934 RepID=A0ABQ6G1R8_9CHLR|nr:hypothetical protein KDH_67540 [Dictyobacter sp. S3.2.2.5]
MPTSMGSQWQDVQAGNLGLSDAAGWNQPQYYETLRLADINGDGQVELMIRGSAGLRTYAYNPASRQWQDLQAGTLGLTDTGGWNQPQYYRTLRVADIDGDGQAELLVRGAAGLRTFAFNRTNKQWQDLNAPIPGTEDANGWNQPQYYETFQLADINADGRDELIFRGPFGLFTYAFDVTRKYWYDLNAGALGLTDAGGWNQPQYYRTFRLADINGDGQAELLVRSAAGLRTFAFNLSNNKWQDLDAPIPGTEDANGWNQPQYYETFQLADINADGRDELIFRGPFGLFTYAFDVTHKYWYDLNAGDLGMTDSAGWGLPQYYRTFRLADINADGQAELLVRGSGGLLAYAFNLATSTWNNLQSDTLGLNDTGGWSNPQYYSTIQAADIDGDGQAELLARAAIGITGWHYNTSLMNMPVLFQAPHYEVSYRLQPDPTLPDGTFAIQQVIPAGDSNTFTCTLFSIQGRRAAQATTAGAQVAGPYQLAVLPGHFFTARLNRANSNLPDLVLRVQLPAGSPLKQQRIVFTWSEVPTVWPTFVTSLNYDVSLNFDGTGAFVDLRSSSTDTGNPSDLQFTGPITLQAWLKPAANDGIRNIIAHGYALNPAGEVFLRIANGQYQVGSWNGADHVAVFPMPLSDLGRWVHLSGVYDGTQWILYRNGQEVARNTDSTGAVAVQGAWAIGARGAGGERFFSGNLRNIALWQEARTAQKIQADMLYPPTENVSGLAAYWGLDEGSGNSGDLGPGAHLATVVGARWITPESLQQLLTLPITPFPQFTPAQQAAYEYISSQLDSASQGNIRARYVNLSLQDSLSPGKLNDLQRPPNAPNYTQEDWDATKSILARELQAAGQVQTLYQRTGTLLNALQIEQTGDLNDVVSKLQDISSTPPSDNSWSDILLTIMGDALGVASVIPEGRIGQMALLVGSDLFGALASGAATSNQPAPPNSAGIQANIISVYQSLVNLNGRQTERILQDGLLLSIVARLAQTIWTWLPSDQQQLVEKIHNQTKIGFYRTLIPQSYVVSEWRNYPATKPVLFVEYQETDVGAPAYAYWASPPPSGSYVGNLYIIHTPGNSKGDTSWNGVPGYEHPINPALYPAQAVMDDLFTQLGVSRQDFFTCTNGWENTSLQPISLPGT